MVVSYWVCHWKKTFWVGGCDGIGGLAYSLFCAAYWTRQPRVFRRLSRSCFHDILAAVRKVYTPTHPDHPDLAYLQGTLLTDGGDGADAPTVHVQVSTYKQVMMTLSNGNNFRVTGPLCGEFTGHRWIPLTKASDAQLWCFLWSATWINGWVNNRGAGDLRRHRAYYDVIVMEVRKK